MSKLLAVIDMQTDFVTGSLGSAEAEAIVPKVVEKIQTGLSHGTEIIFTKDTHDAVYLNTQEGKNLPVEHCIRGTEGWQLIPQLQEYEKNGKVIEKPAFGSLKLAEYVTEHKFDEVELIGLCTDICVISNALLIKAASPETVVCVDASCCAGVTPETHKNALEAMKICQIKIL